MFEIPEYVTLARQMGESLSGKRIANGNLGNSPHKFVWYNRKPDEFAAIVKGKTTGMAYCRGRWLFIPLQPGIGPGNGAIASAVTHRGEFIAHAGARTTGNFHRGIGINANIWIVLESLECFHGQPDRYTINNAQFMGHFTTRGARVTFCFFFIDRDKDYIHLLVVAFVV